MQTIRVALLCGLLFVAAAAQSQGDEVDDLLSGRSTTTAQETASPGNPPESPSLEDRVVAPVDSRPLVDQTPWEIPLGHPSGANLSRDSSARVDHRKPAPSEVNLVPEPTAIALAALALLYFLIFFRRRHLA